MPTAQSQTRMHHDGAVAIARSARRGVPPRVASSRLAGSLFVSFPHRTKCMNFRLVGTGIGFAESSQGLASQIVKRVNVVQVGM